ncbi:hypothetical protein JHK86_031164 [Glycine max]|nr:hypothetical protein JHK86_031164 [Glycine max]
MPTAKPRSSLPLPRHQLHLRPHHFRPRKQRLGVRDWGDNTPTRPVPLPCLFGIGFVVKVRNDFWGI